VIVRQCAEPGCETLVMGGYCLEHEQPQTRVFVRGRPFVRPDFGSSRSEASLRRVQRAFGGPPPSFRLATPAHAAPGFAKAGGRAIVTP
jgi:hypothetical protein